MKSGVLLKVDKRTRNERVIRGTKVLLEKGYHLVPGLDFNDILVFQLADQARAKPVHYEVKHEDIIGKGVLVNGVVSILTKNMLIEL